MTEQEKKTSLYVRALLAAAQLDKLGNYLLKLDSESVEGKLHKKSASIIVELTENL